MEDTLQEQITDYQAIAQQAKSAGRKLVQRLESLGWTMFERVFDYDGPVMISPELMAHEDWELVGINQELADDDVYVLYELPSTWSDHIIEISVID